MVPGRRHSWRAQLHSWSGRRIDTHVLQRCQRDVLWKYGRWVQGGGLYDIKVFLFLSFELYRWYGTPLTFCVPRTWLLQIKKTMYFARAHHCIFKNKQANIIWNHDPRNFIFYKITSSSLQCQCTTFQHPSSMLVRHWTATPTAMAVNPMMPKPMQSWKWCSSMNRSSTISPGRDCWDSTHKLQEREVMTNNLKLLEIGD